MSNFILFIRSMVDGHILAIVNFTGVNIRVQVFVWIPVFNLGSVYVGMELRCNGNCLCICF